jgi:hypothetical protein
MPFNAKPLNLRVLQQGAKGADVLSWQQFLRLKNLPIGTLDSNFGANTIAATRTFQTQNGLPVTGIVNEATYQVAFKQGFLFYIVNLTIAQLLATLGFNDEAVKDLQRVLSAILVVKPTSTAAARPPLAADGDFGPMSTRGLTEVYRQLDTSFKLTLAQRLSAKTKQTLGADFNLAVDILTEFAKRLRQRLSGVEWVKLFPFSPSLEDLSFPFRQSAQNFEKALKAAGAKIVISNTFRPPERAYLMHYCLKVADRDLAAANVPPMAGVNINWVHYTDTQSVAAAEAMAVAYDIAYPPALRSNHTIGRAVDWDITWTGTLNIRDASGKTVSIGEPRSGINNQRLWAVGASYGVKKLPPDPPHWSFDGY